MKIVLVGPVYPFRGGIAHHTTLLARELRLGHDLRVISFRSQFPSWLYPGTSDKDPSRQALRVDAEYLLAPLDPRTWWQVAQRIAALAPKVVVIQWWTTFWAVALGVLTRLLVKRGCRIVYLVHNVLPHNPRPWDAALSRFGLARAAVCVVHTMIEQERLHALLPDMVTVVHPMPAFDLVTRGSMNATRARTQLGLTSSEGVILFFGLVRPYKGLDILLQSMVLLRDSGLRPSLLIAGEFWQDKGIHLRFIDKHGLAGQVIIADRYIPNEELEVYFAACDLVALPYIEATQSGVAQLSFGFGVPVVSTRVGGLAEMIQHGENGLLVEPGDPRALADALSRLLRDKGMLEAMRRSIAESASYSGWPSLAAKLSELGDPPQETDGPVR